MITGVTGFIPIPGHPRSLAEYERLGEQLRDTGIPIMCLNGDLEQCWLWRHLQGRKCTWSTADNPEKNSLAYHCVMAQKSEMLSMAARVDYMSDVFVWIDFGIFHVPGVTAEIICEFMERAQDEQVIVIPGCWEPNYEYDDRFPMWRWCGGVFIVPRTHVEAFNAAMKNEYKRHLRKTGNVSWEVNTLCRIEQQQLLPLWWYKANHDASMFTAYRPVMAQVQ